MIHLTFLHCMSQTYTNTHTNTHTFLVPRRNLVNKGIIVLLPSAEAEGCVSWQSGTAEVVKGGLNKHTSQLTSAISRTYYPANIALI